LLTVLPSFSQTPATHAPEPKTVEAEIHAVEMGLLSPVVVAGDPHMTRSLLDEMMK
jgi:hypothetical protein